MTMLPLKDCKVTSPYGIERTINGVKSIHKGIDLISNSGDREVKSIGDGVIRGNFNDPNGFGNYVSIEHLDGKRVIYAHLESFKKKAGDVVKAGDVIGIEGSTGRSTGIHLHLEVRETPYLKHNRLNIADYLGIKNDYGLVEEKVLTKEEQKQLIKDKAGIDDNSIQYLDFYRFNNDLIRKLANAMK